MFQSLLVIFKANEKWSVSKNSVEKFKKLTFNYVWSFFYFLRRIKPQRSGQETEAKKVREKSKESVEELFQSSGHIRASINKKSTWFPPPSQNLFHWECERMYNYIQFVRLLILLAVFVWFELFYPFISFTMENIPISAQSTE